MVRILGGITVVDSNLPKIREAIEKIFNNYKGKLSFDNIYEIIDTLSDIDKLVVNNKLYECLDTNFTKDLNIALRELGEEIKRLIEDGEIDIVKKLFKLAINDNVNNLNKLLDVGSSDKSYYPFIIKYIVDNQDSMINTEDSMNAIKSYFMEILNRKDEEDEVINPDKMSEVVSFIAEYLSPGYFSPDEVKILITYPEIVSKLPSKDIYALLKKIHYGGAPQSLDQYKSILKSNLN